MQNSILLYYFTRFINHLPQHRMPTFSHYILYTRKTFQLYYLYFNKLVKHFIAPVQRQSILCGPTKLVDVEIRLHDWNGILIDQFCIDITINIQNIYVINQHKPWM